MANSLYWLHAGGIFLAAAIAFTLAVWIRKRHQRAAATWMVRLLAVLGIWGVLILLQLLAQSQELKVLFFLLGKPFGKASFVLWFVFVLVFTGRDHWLTRRVRWTMAGGLGVITLLTVTDPVHGLLWAEYPIVQDGFPHLVPDSKMLEMVIFSGTGVLAFIGFGLMLKSLLTSRQVSRGQLVTILAGFLVAMPSAFLQFTDLLPVAGFEYGQINSIVFFVAVGAAIFRHDLFIVSPFGRDAVFEALDEGIVVVDVYGRIADYNQRATEVLPEVEDRFGESVLTVFPDLMLTSESEAVADGGFTGDLADSFTRTVDDQQRRFAVDVSPLKQRETTRGYGIIFRDQTELEEYAEKLEWQAQKLDEFASTVSHDLRNPLSVARGHLELARESPDRETLDTIDDALDRMSVIIDDTLALAQAGQFDIEQEMTSLEAVATSAWEVIDAGEATLETDGIYDGTLVNADPDRLQTVFENLFRNAVEHGTGDVTIRVESIDGGFAIQDDGPGIPDHERDKVFERGYSTGEDTTGLGLAIVEQIVGAHGWTIEVADSYHSGARFEVRT